MPLPGRKYDRTIPEAPAAAPLPSFVPTVNLRNFALMDRDFEIDGITALQNAREISKLPGGDFTVVFFPYSRSRGEAGAHLVVKEHCKYRTQLPGERFAVDSENYFLFTDAEGDPKMCYRILIRFMAFPQDGYKLHKINWL